MRSVDVTEAAYLDLVEAWNWYEDQQEGLGDRFMLSFHESLSRIQRMPDIFPDVAHRIRRAMMRRFPFGVYFVTEHERVVIIAVLHGSRDPETWKSRPQG